MARQAAAEHRPVSRSHRGATFIELLIFIIVVAIAVTGVLGAIAFATRGSADPLVRIRAAELGQAYLEEILSKRFDGSNCGSRPDYDGVACYDGLCAAGEQPPRDALGSVRPGYPDYRVFVCVSDSTLQGQDMRRVVVQVQTPTGERLDFTGRKGDNP
ncbi:MAG: hypothetical protein WED00_10660 [Aquisalimonadaceae bacterium]